ncbi:SET domain-containing protein [Rhizodiscina lignyota]|uniref:SET domain-containing protein n=1 Tax=Rhizodiscina lignyota TaxID=1504668 RepID=A0A9P4IRE4_9PEZI|nr:SET domain-containing protein [Rhizodiscina lignyota]
MSLRQVIEMLIHHLNESVADGNNFFDNVTSQFHLYKRLVRALRGYHGSLPQYLQSKEEYDLAGPTQSPDPGYSRIQVSTWVIQRYLQPCHVSIDLLSGITIVELRAGIHHQGRKLLAKVIGASYMSNGFRTIVEDKNGDVIALVVCNPPPNIDPQDLLPLNSLIVVKQPLFEVWFKRKGEFDLQIRVDHLSDLVMKLDARYHGNSSVLDSQEWKAKGKHDMTTMDTWNAIACYTQGIKVLDPSNDPNELVLARDLFSDRAMAYLDRGQYELAYYDACKACDIQQNMHNASPGLSEDGVQFYFHQSHDQALWVKATALYGLREFRGCYQICSMVLKAGCVDDMRLEDEWNHLYQRTIARWFESENGVYNWKLIRKGVKRDKIDNDIASYAAAVEVKDAGEMGRGLFANRIIREGRVVLAEKAFAYAKGEARGQETHLNVLHDLTRDAPQISAGEALLEKTLASLQNLGPEWRRQFFKLYSGGYPSGDRPFETALSTHDQPIIDVFHVLSIIRMNSMACGPSDEEESDEENLNEPDRDEGLWIQASYTNHSCNPNCKVSSYGDMLVLRAVRRIEPGEQITVNYVPMNVAHEQRHAILKANWDFECGCEA